MNLRAFLAILAAASAAAPAGAQDVRDARVERIQDALNAGELICEFRAGWKRSVIADLLRDPPPRVEQMLVYEAVGTDRAKVVSTRAPGRREVEVRATGKAVHLMERAGPSLLVTTLTRCERTAWKAGSETCIRYAARHAWHFDLAALREPDVAYERLPSGALSGACEPWQMP